MKKIFFAAMVATSACTQAGPVVNQKAPPIQVSEWLTTSPSYNGKPVLLEFWATWCGPCRMTIPHIQEIYNTYTRRGLVVISITDEDRDTVTPFVEGMKMTYPIGLDLAQAASRAYQVRAIPSAFLIDKNGVLRWSGHPARLRPADLDAILPPAPAPKKS